MKNQLTRYEQEALTALYKSLEYLECNDLPTNDVAGAILKIEALNKNNIVESVIATDVEF